MEKRRYEMIKGLKVHRDRTTVTVTFTGSVETLADRKFWRVLSAWGFGRDHIVVNTNVVDDTVFFQQTRPRFMDEQLNGLDEVIERL